ncbi:CBS domain-containing protein [Actinoalloteichus sp. AHMU CJ021]|uniref:CBS domain-containing protein n=1 Tax=Actinoalloteichus caeruleus DSM 43889 TaxID=1120930 RepID=A0ABT1JH74_ACTCY|nr:CBS domain-containing protein [Actinoalloteichus caeruleus]AUS77803.1 CBS domain-containing protein [Actinoalloteichus sp. AHMU CJ021]MCP2331758.1 CBS domain-containing protein [Actinoalloteichus caeruleus DSM 43889]
MVAVRELMHQGAECVGENQTLSYAARRMRDLGVGAMPVCGNDDKLHGMVTDRDIVVKCVAEGHDPTRASVSDLAEGRPFCVRAEADVSEAIDLMERHQVKRLPVIDDHRLVGIVSEADLVGHVSAEQLGELIEALKAPSAASA